MDGSHKKENNIFNNNSHHINFADNTLVEKLPRVEYEVEYGYFDNGESDNSLEEDSLMLGNDEYLYTYENRPLRDMDTIFEKKMSKRLASFHAKLIDRTQFDKELLRKQLDLETINITMNDEEDVVKEMFINECDGQCTGKAYNRAITKEINEEGKMRRLINELEEIAQNYGIAFEEALQFFEQVSCSKKHLKLLLEKKSFTVWTQLDDMALQHEGSIEYNHLLEHKSIEEIERRKRFLGLQ